MPNIAQVINVDQLRLAAALAHAVPGAELKVRCANRERLVVSRHPAADLTPGAFRRLVLVAQAQPVRSPHRRRGSMIAVDELVLGGAVHDLGGGVARSVESPGRERRWLATTLRWERVGALLESWSDDDRSMDGIDATIAPDVALGVTLVRLDQAPPAEIADLDRTALAVSATLVVDELLNASHAASTDTGA